MQSSFSGVSRSLQAGDVVARFFPYSELKHSWCSSGGVLRFKVSDYLEHSPEAVLESLAWHLVNRALGRRCPGGRADAYLSYVASRALWERNKDLYLSRARGLTFDPMGEVRDLDEVFGYVNSFYFGGRLPHPMLAWSAESPRTRLGFFFAPLNLLVANAALDSERVPRYVLEFVMYHELLHHVEAGSGGVRRRVHHTKSFKEQERRFTHFDDAERWLRRIVSEKKR